MKKWLFGNDTKGWLSLSTLRGIEHFIFMLPTHFSQATIVGISSEFSAFLGIFSRQTLGRGGQREEVGARGRNPPTDYFLQKWEKFDSRRAPASITAQSQYWISGPAQSAQSQYLSDS